MHTHMLPRLMIHDAHLDVRVRHAFRAVCRLTRERVCALGGHDYLLKTERNRMFLRCAACGHDTRGWCIDVMAHRMPSKGIQAGVPAPASDAAHIDLQEQQMNTSGRSRPIAFLQGTY